MSLQKQGVLRRSSIDPRTVLLSVLVINAVALSHGHLPTLLISIAFSSIALATVKPHYGLICLFAFALSYLGYWGLLQLPGSTFFAFSAAIFSWLSRFVISMSIGAFGLLTLTPSTLTSALRDLCLPGWATIPPAVFLRVFADHRGRSQSHPRCHGPSGSPAWSKKLDHTAHTIVRDVDHPLIRCRRPRW